MQTLFSVDYYNTDVDMRSELNNWEKASGTLPLDLCVMFEVRSCVLITAFFIYFEF